MLRDVISVEVVRYSRKNREKAEFHFWISVTYRREELQEVRYEYQLSYIKREIKIELKLIKL